MRSCKKKRKRRLEYIKLNVRNVRRQNTKEIYNASCSLEYTMKRSINFSSLFKCKRFQPLKRKFKESTMESVIIIYRNL